MTEGRLPPPHPREPSHDPTPRPAGRGPTGPGPTGDDPASPFRTWNGVEAHEFSEGIRLHAIGGEQVLLCRVAYEPGKRIPLHSHEHTEQLMAIVDGSVEMAIEGKWQTLRPGDVVVVNRGLEHELYSERGVTFFEALAPVPLDHVPDRDRDLVLGPGGGSQHVER